MKKIAVITLLFSSITCFASSEATNLKVFLDSKKEQILALAQDKYVYTFQPFDIDAQKCVGKSSEIGPVGVCLVELSANEESVVATFAISVASYLSGTGDSAPVLDLTLIDYEL